jgi:hypothetical protein
MIDIEKITDDTYEVTVRAKNPTTHEVTVPDAYYRELTNGAVSPEVLLEKSFEFLLQREPNTSILSTFELPVINRYFPEYEHTMRDEFS